MLKKSMTFLLYFLFIVFFSCLIYLNDYFPLNSIRSQQLYRYVGSHMSKDPPLAQNLVEKLKQAVELNPNNCDAQNLLATNYGIIAFGRKIETGVIKDQEAYNNTNNTFREIIQRCPNTLDEFKSRYYLAYMYYYAGNFSEAIREVDQLVNKYPSGVQDSQLSDAYDLLANIYEEQDDKEHRLVALIQSLYSNPDLNKAQQTLNNTNSLVNSDKKLKQLFSVSKTLGFGKFPTASISNGVVRLIGTLPNSSVVSSFTSKNNTQWNETRVLLVKDSVVGSVSIDRNENIHAAYAVDSTIFYITNPDNIESVPLLFDVSEWCKVCQISEIDAGITSIQIHKDSQSIPNLIWTFPTVGLAYSKILDGKLSTPELFAPYGEHADFVLDNANNIHAVYDVSNGDVFPTATTRVWYREKVNEEWREPIQLSEKNIWAGGATISMTQDGTMHVVYISGSTDDDAKLMYVHRNPDGVWDEPQVIADKKFRPWIPMNYGGRYTVASKALADNAFALIWRVPKDENSTYLVGRKLDQSGWSAPIIITEIHGQDYKDTPSIVQESQLYLDNLKLIWSNAGEIKYLEWRP